ncbi:hypothetical protein PINS_up019687 [Pythium insidiosum]|nr:hypothetical protein PINS_up019687 [Pythium insidiosum]
MPLLLLLLIVGLSWGVEAQTASGLDDVMKLTQDLMAPLGRSASSLIDHKRLKMAGNSVTITGSKVLFGRADRDTLVTAIRNVVLAGRMGTLDRDSDSDSDAAITQTVLSVLNVPKHMKSDGAVQAKLRAVLASRAERDALERHIEALVETAEKSE